MTTKAGTEKCDLPCLQRKRVKDRERERMEEQGKNEEKKKVMVAIDESEFSQYAFNWALENLRDTIQSSQLVVFTAQPIDFASTYAASYGAAPAQLVTSLLENHKKVALALLEKAKEICAKHGIVAETVTEVGDPKVVICEAVEKHNIQLLVLGSHGRGGIQRYLTCSFDLRKPALCLFNYHFDNIHPKSLINRDTTALVWPTKTEGKKMGEAIPRGEERMGEAVAKGAEKKVMVAIDESECSHYALMWVLDNLKDSITNSPLIIFMAQTPSNGNFTFSASLGAARMYYPMSSSQEFVYSSQESHRKFALALLEKAKQICANRGVNAETVTEVGDPKEAICDAVKKHGIKLLIVGERGLGKIKRAILGSVSNYCVQYAKCPVLVVKKSQANALA